MDNMSPPAWRAVLDVFPDAILILDPAYHVVYCNPAFEKVFGWPLDDIAGRNVDFVPPDLVRISRACMERLHREKKLHGIRTRRLTKGGGKLDVIMDAALLADSRGETAGLVFSMRDITDQKRRERGRKMLLRLSGALHRFRQLDDLLGHVARLIRALLGVGGASVILLEPDAERFHFQKASYIDADVGRRLEGMKFPADQGAAGQVYRTGKPLIVNDYAHSPYRLPVQDKGGDDVVQNMLAAPLRIQDRCIGVLSVVNKREGGFDDQDAELLCAIADVVALPIDNAAMNNALQEAYDKVQRHDRAKDRAIHHLSHELKTPLAVLSACLRLLDKAGSCPMDPRRQRVHDRIERNLHRLLEMEYKLEDILRAGEDPDILQP